MTKTLFVAHISPMRHDDPRRATRATRAQAAKDAADALKAEGLRIEYRSADRDAVEREAQRMSAALAAVDREASFRELTAIPLNF